MCDVQIQRHFCGEDSQGAEGAEAPQGHQQGQRVKGTTPAAVEEVINLELRKNYENVTPKSFLTLKVSAFYLYW